MRFEKTLYYILFMASLFVLELLCTEFLAGVWGVHWACTGTKLRTAKIHDGGERVMDDSTQNLYNL